MLRKLCVLCFDPICALHFYAFHLALKFTFVPANVSMDNSAAYIMVCSVLMDDSKLHS